MVLPKDASVGQVETRAPRRSGLATSVMYTMAGLVPIPVGDQTSACYTEGSLDCVVAFVWRAVCWEVSK
jgi:hypothetical protein